MRALLRTAHSCQRHTVVLRVRPFSFAAEEVAPAEGKAEEEQWAFNHVEKKKRLLKPRHTVEEQMAYMDSKVFQDSYKGLPVYKWYRRNIVGQAILQPPPRLFCIDKEGRFRLNHACPICRDEYLFFDYRVSGRRAREPASEPAPHPAVPGARHGPADRHPPVGPLPGAVRPPEGSAAEGARAR